jgi:DNA-binding response OmpR family regulator
MVADFGARVLVADSDPVLRQRLFSKLLDLDIFSDCVANGRDALEKLTEYAYTVVIIDLGLPGVAAAQLIDRISKLALRPVVLVLAARPEAARVLDVEIVQIVLRKPIDVLQLAELARSCIRSTRARATAAPAAVAAPPPIAAPQSLTASPEPSVAAPLPDMPPPPEDEGSGGQPTT